MAQASDSQSDLGPLHDRSNSRSPSPNCPAVATQHTPLPSAQSKILRSPSSLQLAISDDSLTDGGASEPSAASQDGATLSDLPRVGQRRDSSIASLGAGHEIGQAALSTSTASTSAAQFRNRPYGRPLSTILERSSYATLRSKLSRSSSKRRFTPVHVDPDSQYLHTESAPIEDVRRTNAWSFDESALWHSPLQTASDRSSEQPSSTPTRRPSLEDAINPSLPPLAPPQRVSTPDGLPRWPNDEQSRCRRRNWRRGGNPLLAFSSLIRRASVSNDRLVQHHFWRPMPGTETPGFSGLENHPFNTAERASPTFASPACRSLSLALRPISPNQPARLHRRASGASSRQSTVTAASVASLPRSLEIRNNRRAVISEETYPDNPSDVSQVNENFLSSPNSVKERRDLRIDSNLSPPSPALLSQQTSPDDGLSNSDLEFGEALRVHPKAKSPTTHVPNVVVSDHTRDNQRQETLREGSPSFLIAGTRGDIEQRYACSGVPIHRTDAASDHAIPRPHLELDQSGDNANTGKQFVTPERQSRPSEVVFVSPESGTATSTPRDTAVASLSSRHLFTSPAISNTRRAQQPSAATPMLRTFDGHVNDRDPQEGTRTISSRRPWTSSSHHEKRDQVAETSPKSCMLCKIKVPFSWCFSRSSKNCPCRPNHCREEAARGRDEAELATERAQNERAEERE